MRKKSDIRRPLTGKALLELAAAALILLGPTVLERAAEGWGLYVLFAVTAAVFAVRVIETGRIHISVNTVLGVLCFVYALLAMLWASGPYYNVRLIFVLLTLTLTGMLAADYLDAEKGGGLEARITGLVTVSAFICAVWNLIAWVAIDRLELASPLRRGLGSNELLGAYMLAGLWCCVKTFYPRTVRRKRERGLGLMLVCGLPMTAVLIMSRCFLTGIFAGAFLLLYGGLRKRKRFGLFGLALSVLSAAGLVIFGKPAIIPFADGLMSGLTHPGGLGGGGFIVRQGQLQSEFYQIDAIGAGAGLVSSLGIFGLLAALGFLGWAVYLAISRKSRMCTLGALVCGLTLFVRPGMGALSLAVCLLVYNEWKHEKTVSFELTAGRYAVTAIVGVFAIAACILTAAEAFKAVGKAQLEAGELRSAAENLSVAGKLDPFDGESCALAAQASRGLYLDEGVKNDIVNAEYFIGLAENRETGRAAYYAAHAVIMADSGRPDEAVELDRRALELAPLWDDCRIQMAEHLYALIQTMEKGSYTAQNCHMEILSLADAVKDLDKKKLISDYEAKAQPYTRVEYNYGEDESQAETEEDTER